jgi:hypothetical protein
VRILGVDPGLTTGLATIVVDRGGDWRYMRASGVQVEAGHTETRVRELLETHRYDMIATEWYQIGPRSGRTSGRRHQNRTVTLAQKVCDIARDLGVPWRTWRAIDVKPWATDGRLRAAGLWFRGLPHARDGARMAMFAAVREFGVADPLSRRNRG